MLEFFDRLQLVVRDADAAAQRLAALFDAERGAEDTLRSLGARRVTLQLPQSQLELLEPRAEGPVRDFAARRGEGLFAGGFACADLPRLGASLGAAGVPWVEEGGQLFVGPTQPGGLRLVCSPPSRVGAGTRGLIRKFYEVTNPVADLDAAVQHYCRAFGLAPTHFVPIGSRVFGYRGTLTLLRPGQLDRIEVTRTFDAQGAMGRFFEKHGESLYMAFAETDDIDALRARLDAQGARYAMRPPGDGTGRPDVLFIHPGSALGVLIGVSLTGVAWEWSTGKHLA
jgi:catechol 2,3-dioxygenase-like lactoylglutathione lyase family enzyme